MYLACEALLLKTTKQKGAWQRTSLKVGQHIYCDILYYNIYFNPGDNERNDSTPLSQRSGARDDQVMSCFLKRVYVYSVSYFMYLAWRPFRWRRRSRRGRGKGLPLKVGQHIYCDRILYYTYILTPEDNERNDSTTQSKEGPRDDQVMSFSLK